MNFQPLGDTDTSSMNEEELSSVSPWGILAVVCKSFNAYVQYCTVSIAHFHHVASSARFKRLLHPNATVKRVMTDNKNKAKANKNLHLASVAMQKKR